MHHTHQPYKQIWAHPLPNGHLLWQLWGGGGQPTTFEKKRKKKLKVRLNIMDEGYPLNNESIA